MSNHPHPDPHQPTHGQAYQAPGQGYQPPADQPPFPQTGTPSSYGQDQSWRHEDPHRGGGRADGEDRTWAILAHLSAPIASVVSAGWLTIVGPLAVWLLKKEDSPYVRKASAGAFNFTISMWVASVVGWLLTITVIGAVIGIPLIIIGMLGPIILGIVGAVKASGGQEFTYPWQLRVLN